LASARSPGCRANDLLSPGSDETKGAMHSSSATFRCIECDARYPLTKPVYQCERCQSLLEVHHPPETLTQRTPEEWRALFSSRHYTQPGPDGSGVWRYREWVLPDLPTEDIVTLGEGGTPLVRAERLGDELGIELLVKQCGQSLSGSFKDLGMTVLVSQV